MVSAITAMLILVAAQFGLTYTSSDPALVGVGLKAPPIRDRPLEDDYVPPWLIPSATGEFGA